MYKKPQRERIIMLLLTSVLLLSACGSRDQNTQAGGSSSATPTSSIVSVSTPASVSTPTPASVNTPTPSSSPNGTLTGSVMAGPACPGPVTDGNTCPDKPVIQQQVQIMNSDGQMITTVITDQKGQFTITLAPGSYLLRVSTSKVALHGTSSATPATVLAGRTTSLRITMDTGMR